MLAISSISPALFRRMLVCLFGAAALMFAVLTTSLAVAAEVAPGSDSEGQVGRCADIANAIAGLSSSPHAQRQISIDWFWGYDAEGEHVSHDGYCLEQKEWLAGRGHSSPQCPVNIDSDLFWAVYRGNMERAKHLLSECGADPNARNNYGQTALRWAVKSAEMAELLLDNGADANARDKGGRAPLHYAMSNLDVVDVLLNHSAKINIEDNAGWTPMDWAAYGGHVKVAGKLQNAGGECNFADSSGPLCQDARAPCLSHSSQPVGDGQESEIRMQRHLNKALRGIVQNHEKSEAADLARECLEQGANANMYIRNGNLLLHAAAERDAAGVARVLLEYGADINAENAWEDTPLFIAAKHNAAGVVAVLLENGAEVDARGRYNVTPLHRAASNGAFEAGEVLIANGAKVNARSDGDSTPLHYIGRNASAKIAELLLTNGADVNAMNKFSNTPLDNAVDRKNAGVAAVLRSGGGECHNRTGPLCGGVTRVDRLRALKNLNDLLFDAAQRNDTEMARQLFSYGANANARDESRSGINETPLHVAAFWNAAEMVSLLIDKGADVNAKDDNGETPLDWAAGAMFSEEAAGLLRDAGGVCIVRDDIVCEEDEFFDDYESWVIESQQARDELADLVASAMNALPVSFGAFSTKVGLNDDMELRANIRRDFRWDGADWGLEAHIGAVGESDSQAAFTEVGGSKDFAGGWRAVGAAKVARGWTQLEGGLERGALWASEFSAGFERLGLFYGGDALGFGVSQPLHVEHWEAETADGRRFRGSQLSGRVLNVDASYRIPLPGGENGMMEFSAAVGRESGSESGFEGDALISAEWDF